MCSKYRIFGSNLALNVIYLGSLVSINRRTEQDTKCGILEMRGYKAVVETLQLILIRNVTFRLMHFFTLPNIVYQVLILVRLSNYQYYQQYSVLSTSTWLLNIS